MNDLRKFNFQTTPIVDVVNYIIIDAVNQNASDIHFDPAENYMKIRIRVDGDLRDYAIIDNKYKRNLATRVKLLSGMNITESRLPQDGAIKSRINGKDLDLRVASLPTKFGEKIVIRILDYSMSFEGLETLGFTKDNYEIILKMLANPNGIILVTGATGSGKSTTVYSMIQRLNKEETNIITVEDPVEMNIEGINQVQVNSDIGLSFATVLRSILREDPNIILIGEIRDSETAQIAIRASITGHLVLSTLHTNNSITTIERLVDMNVERYLLSSSLKGIISQTLAKRLCPKCKKLRKTTDTEKRIFKKALNLDVDEIYEPGKCDNCRNGYRGRIALQEVLYINDNIRNAINNQVKREELHKMIYTSDVKTLLQDGLLKVANGITTIEEVFKLVDAADDESNILGRDIQEVITNTIHKKQSELKDEENLLKEKNSSYNSDNNKIDTNEIVKQNKEDEIKEKKLFNEFKEIEKNNTYSNIEKENFNNSNNELQKIEIEPSNFNKYSSYLDEFEDDQQIDEENELISEDEISNKQQFISKTSQIVDNNSVNFDDTKKSDSYTDDLINLINQGFFE